MNRVLAWLSKRLPQPRIIYDIDGVSPYLSRFYLLGRPEMPDGSEPFNEDGSTRPGHFMPSRLGLFLHRFHRGDTDRELHNHPWRWSVAFILSGGYIEERRKGNEVIRRRIGPGRLNFIGQNDFHRVDLIDGEAWSLFLAGPKASSWGFWNREDGTVTPWREFIQAARMRAA